MKKELKICLACSVGGHLTQILQIKKMYAQYKYFFITEDTPLTRDLANKEKVYYVKLINRKKWNFIFLLLVNTILSIKYQIKEKPDIVISTGALSAVPICFIAKLMGKKVVFIESFAKIHTPTMTGKIIYRIADLFIVQWEDLLKYYPKAVYGGSIY